MHTCGKLMVILISCSMLSFVLGSDLHSLFAPAPRTLSMLNLVSLKGSHAEQSSLCNLVVWLGSPAIENTGHQKETPYFAISKITAEKVMWKRLQAEPRCEDEEKKFHVVHDSREGNSYMVATSRVGLGLQRSSIYDTPLLYLIAILRPVKFMFNLSSTLYRVMPNLEPKTKLKFCNLSVILVNSNEPFRLLLYIGHYRVAFRLFVKMNLQTKRFIWKYVPPTGSISCNQTKFLLKTRFETGIR